MSKHAAYRVRFTLPKREFSRGQSPHARLTVEFDADRRILNPRTVAAHSSHGWGKWNHASKYPSDLGHVWSVSTPGHGGIIVVTQTPLPEAFEPAINLTTHRAPAGYHLASWDEAGLAIARRDGLTLKTFELYVYDFEEDCAYAEACLLDRNIAAGLGREWVRQQNAEQVQAHCRQTVARWSDPAVCEHFGIPPRPGGTQPGHAA